MANAVASALGLGRTKRSSSKAHFVVAAPLELTRIGTADVFASVRLFKPDIGPGVYGGQMAAQSAWAATQTVSPEYSLHSLHGHFIHAGDARHPIVYSVERLRDGKSYATRAVRAQQNGRVCFLLTCSFHRPGPAESGPDTPSFAPSMPSVDISPEAGITTSEKVKRLLENSGPSAPKMLRDKMRTAIGELGRMPIEVVNALDNEDDLALGSGDNTSYCWIRVRGPMPPDQALQKCALVFTSDWQITFVVPKSLELSPFTSPALDKAVSLDHSIHFYSPPDLDMSDWHLYETTCPVAGGASRDQLRLTDPDGRGIARGRLWSRDGKLVAIIVRGMVVRHSRTQTQEAHVRAVVTDRPSRPSKL